MKIQRAALTHSSKIKANLERVIKELEIQLLLRHYTSQYNKVKA